MPRLADTQCGFKFFAGDVARAAARRLRIDGFAFDVELLRAISDMGAAGQGNPGRVDGQGRIDSASSLTARAPPRTCVRLAYRRPA